jgi:hypothetical protein
MNQTTLQPSKDLIEARSTMKANSTKIVVKLTPHVCSSLTIFVLSLFHTFIRANLMVEYHSLNTPYMFPVTIFDFKTCMCTMSKLLFKINIFTCKSILGIKKTSTIVWSKAKWLKMLLTRGKPTKDPAVQGKILIIKGQILWRSCWLGAYLSIFKYWGSPYYGHITTMDGNYLATSEKSCAVKKYYA